MSELRAAIVLAGGLAYERDVSLRSGERVMRALRGVGVDTVCAEPDLALLTRLTRETPDAVFIALYGEAGEDGAIRTVLELAGVPYVGTTAAAARLAYDKALAKATVAAADLRTPPWIVLPQSSFKDLGATAVLELVLAGLGLPLVVKPSSGGSALGVSVVGAAADLPSALMTSFSYARSVLVERFVAGVEVAVSVIDTGSGPQALPPVEIEVAGDLFDYAARYTPGATRYHVPARLEARTLQELADVALRAHAALGLRDLSRTDCIVDPQGAVHLLEVNVSPGMTETSLLPLAAEAAGWDLGTLCRDLLTVAAARARVPARPTSR